jgi:hypothetical protein
MSKKKFLTTKIEEEPVPTARFKLARQGSSDFYTAILIAMPRRHLGL